MKNKYNSEELDLLKSIENGEWNSIKNIDDEKKKYQEIASNTLKKDKRVNIRMTQHDLLALQRKANEEGLPYQTLISSLLHKYINGNLVDVTSLKHLIKRIS